MQLLDKPKLSQEFQIGDKVICIDDSRKSLTNGNDFIYNGVSYFNELVRKNEIYCISGFSESGGLYLTGIQGTNRTDTGREMSWHKARFKLVNR